MIKLKRVINAVCAFVLALFGVIGYAIFIEPGQLVVQRQTIVLPNWSPELNHLKVAVLSDLHVGSWQITVDKLHKIVELVDRENPDLIFLLGDFVTGHGGHTTLKPEEFAFELRGLKAKYGVFGVLGNHDWWFNGSSVRTELEKADVTILENDVKEVRVNGDSLWVCGLADSWTRNPDVKGTLQKVPARASCIMMMHEPDTFAEVPESVSLSLAGHTHGGQVALPLVGAIIVPTKLGSRFARGLIHDKNRTIFITSGIGTSILPVRFGVPPEICILDLCSR